MPELPDVEEYRRFFARHAAGRSVRRVVVPDATIVRNATPRALDRALRGRTFEEPDRHGKWLVAWTDGPALLLHFGMTGDLVWSAIEPERHRHDRVILELDGGDELRYRNMRKLGGAWLAHDPDEAVAAMGSLGPDALAVKRREFHERLSRRRGQAKAVLMDQRFMAGLGNLLVDELLWQTRIHPRRRVETLDDTERDRLYETMRWILRRWVAGYGRVPRRGEWLIAVRDAGGPCPRCGGPLARITAAGRTTWLCPTCQPDPAP
ncbi:MAG: Fpg/Nei family DNA glycosylase [Actinobacteria bacterium]|nr:Fpg/Nei family DNA glycosylase [Actinomycetota bacterium]